MKTSAEDTHMSWEDYLLSMTPLSCGVRVLNTNICYYSYYNDVVIYFWEINKWGFSLADVKSV